jgi:hypothetical protein
MSDLTILEPARKPGGQPGNTNALRHGFYAKNLGLEGPKSIDEYEMRNLLGEAAMLKDFMFKIYTNGIESTDQAQIAETLRALSLASMALSRIMDVHYRIKLTVPDDSIEAQNARLQGTIASLKLTRDELRGLRHD